MTKASSYEILRIEGSFPPIPILPTERRALFQLTDAHWRLIFGDSKRELSCGLLHSRVSLDPLDRRRCRASIADVSGEGFGGAVVLDARAEKVRDDLERRLGALERASAVVAAIGAGEWWWDSRFFGGLDWSQSLSVAGVHYRAGWWGTGRVKPSRLPKVLDFGPTGITLRGWRTCFEIPWDTVASLSLIEGDRRMASGSHHRPRVGTTVVVRSHAGQDAAFFTPLLALPVVRDLLEPLISQFEEHPSIPADPLIPI